MSIKKYLPFIFLILIFINGCGGGIAPEEPVTEFTGFSGTVIFTGTWPTGIQRAHLVVFRNPLTSAASFNILNVAFVSDSIPIGQAEYTYDSKTNRLTQELFDVLPGEYAYTAVAVTESPEIVIDRSAWYIVGVYYNNGDTTVPGKFSVKDKSTTRNVDIHCDFNNPPPQPPEF